MFSFPADHPHDVVRRCASRGPNHRAREIPRCGIRRSTRLRGFVTRTHTYTANSLMTVVLPRVSLDGLGLVTLAVYLIVVGGWCIR